MLLAQDFRRQAHVCARLADDCDDPHLAERLTAMASDLLGKAEYLKERQACSTPSGSTKPNNKIIAAPGRRRIKFMATKQAIT